MKTFVSVTVVSAVAVGVLAGCSSVSGTAIVEPVSTSSSPSNNPQRPVSDHLLQAADVPAGFTVLDVPTDQINESTESILSTSTDSKFSPTECQPDLSEGAAAAIENADSSYFMDTSTGDLIANTVTSDASYIDTYRKYNLGPCSQHEILTMIDGQLFTATATTVRLDIDIPQTDGELVLRRDASALFQGVQVPRESTLMAFFPIDGAVVTVLNKNVVGGDTPDVDAFEDIVAAAAHRATGK